MITTLFAMSSYVHYWQRLFEMDALSPKERLYEILSQLHHDVFIFVLFFLKDDLEENEAGDDDEMLSDVDDGEQMLEDVDDEDDDDEDKDVGEQGDVDEMVEEGVMAEKDKDNEIDEGLWLLGYTF